MNNDFRSTQLASKTVGNYFLLEHWTEPWLCCIVTFPGKMRAIGQPNSVDHLVGTAQPSSYAARWRVAFDRQVGVFRVFIGQLANGQLLGRL